MALNFSSPLEKSLNVDRGLKSMNLLEVLQKYVISL